MDAARRRSTAIGPTEDRLLAFYGDDFTGSTDAMDALARAGVDPVLFVSPPDESDLAAFPDAEAVGVAGASRSMTPAEMDDALPPAFAALAATDAPIVHYKVCSTFDSAPDVGSIGHATDLGAAAFGTAQVPVCVGVPRLERYVAFGHLYAAAGDGAVYRIDRHPTMRDHPTTPMRESDLRRHLGDQTDRSVALVDLRTVERGVEAVAAAAADRDAGAVVYDTTRAAHVETVGDHLRRRADARPPGEQLFVVGSSGVEYALTAAWGRAGGDGGDSLAARDRVAVVSGSASPDTAAQIAHATERGFAGVRLDAPRLVDPETREAAVEAAVETARAHLADGASPLCYLVRGPDDDAIAATEARAREAGVDRETMRRRLGQSAGRVLRRLVERAGLDRVAVAGGDTCSHAVPELGVTALGVAGPLSPGAPLCTAHAEAPALDGLQIALKGGQLGDEAYFTRVRDGRPEGEGRADPPGEFK
jgi:uncharacterized protein YgbK (DUF1537 family)